ncbi:hypothetical protein DPMN_055823 [Dreissena polymorpha]|uniref:Uncharacterized protein n=1 Tax=Dreissena polymorpha TaxID=45954 RepID=A0A9D4CTB9_DREPO|nr:hypothetical protein DPMN_055823 [Dreissena polymorpha]
MPPAARDSTGQYPPPNGHANPHYNRHKGDNRELMDKSKSIPNLHMDNSFDGRGAPGAIRPAQSVSALQQQQQQQRVPSQHADYYNQPHSLDDSRSHGSHDYENQPVRTPLDAGRGYPGPGANQPSSGVQFRSPGQPAPATMSTRPTQPQSFERPQSQYFAGQDRPDFQNGRPRSEEFTPERLQNWQDPDRSKGSPHDSFDGRGAPNYSNIRPQANYANQGEIRKMDMGNQQPKQPNFYENTYPRQQEPTPPFQQLKRPPSESEKGRPPTAPKPTPKPNQPLVQPVEIPRSEVDNRQTQPHFYNPQLRDKAAMYPSSSSPNAYNTSPGSHSHYQNTSFYDGRADGSSKMSPLHGDFSKNPHMALPAPHDMAPELPPPPNMDDIHDQDELMPPLPPPPVNDYRLEQKIREEQNRMMQQQPSDPSYSNLPPQNSRKQPFSQSLPAHSVAFSPTGYTPPQATGYQPVQKPGPSFQPAISTAYQTQQPQSLPVQPSGYNASHDYQNINYPNNRGSEPPNSATLQANTYESYDPRKAPPPTSSQQQPQQPRPVIHQQIKDQREAIVSPWQREEREKQQQQQQESLTRIRDMEIDDLTSRPHRTLQEEERLKKLVLEAEFQRRLEEVQDRDDEESDDDRFMQALVPLQSLQEDLVKSRMKIQDFEQKRQYEDAEKEKDRMQRLERRIEMFERDREEQKQRQQRRLEKQQREQEEHFRKQKVKRFGIYIYRLVNYLLHGMFVL